MTSGRIGSLIFIRRRKDAAGHPLNMATVGNSASQWTRAAGSAAADRSAHEKTGDDMELNLVSMPWVEQPCIMIINGFASFLNSFPTSPAAAPWECGRITLIRIPHSR